MHYYVQPIPPNNPLKICLAYKAPNHTMTCHPTTWKEAQRKHKLSTKRVLTTNWNSFKEISQKVSVTELRRDLHAISDVKQGGAKLREEQHVKIKSAYEVFYVGVQNYRVFKKKVHTNFVFLYFLGFPAP